MPGMSGEHPGSEEPDKVRQSLEIADAVARATHLWTRSICLNELERPTERIALAGGLVTALSEHLELDPAIGELIAYVYTLLDDEGDQALSVSRMMLKPPVSAARRRAYERGRTEAAGIVDKAALSHKINPPALVFSFYSGVLPSSISPVHNAENNSLPALSSR